MSVALVTGASRGIGRQLDALIAAIPQQHAGDPADVAELVAWLCSKEARFVTESVFVTDGGMTA